MSRAKNWCFTLNNYDEADCARLLIQDDKIKYLIYGKERGENGTMHLQGFVSFKDRVSFNVAKSYVSNRCHLEVARNCTQSITYCKKENDFYEVGEFTVSIGKRSDLDDFKDAVKAGMSDMKDVRELHSEVAMKYPRFCIDYLRDNRKQIPVEDHPFREWQEKLNEMLNRPPDARSIVFVVDRVGNSGKTWFAHFYSGRHEKAQVLMPGKRADLAYMLNEDIRVLFVDAPRSKNQEFIQYDFLEEVKNGYVFCPKYESCVKRLGKCHVVVLMNEHPDMTKLSQDRYIIIEP